MPEPSPQTWTLRLKNRKTTVLLHIDPLQTFASIKAELLAALREAPLHEVDGKEAVALPTDPAHIQFGRPVNINDPSAGFVLGEWETSGTAEDLEDGVAAAGGVEEEEGQGKGKAKGKAAGRPKKEGGAEALQEVKQCPKGAGLRDNAVLAFRWTEECDAEEEDGDEAMRDEGATSWGVVIPSYEDSYGVENEGDVGGRSQYEG